METFSALLAICAGNSPVTGEFPAQRPVTRGFDVFFDLRLNKRLSKQSWGRWFETLSRSLWRHSNGADVFQTGTSRVDASTLRLVFHSWLSAFTRLIVATHNTISNLLSTCVSHTAMIFLCCWFKANHLKYVCELKNRRWNALDPYIIWLTTSPANHRPANFWFFFFYIQRKLWKVVQPQVQLMSINFKFEVPILWLFQVQIIKHYLLR